MVHRLRPVIKNECEKLKSGTIIKMIEQPAGPPTLGFYRNGSIWRGFE